MHEDEIGQLGAMTANYKVCVTEKYNLLPERHPPEITLKGELDDDEA